MQLNARMPSIHKALGSVHSTEKEKRQQKYMSPQNLHKVFIAVLFRIAKSGNNPNIYHLMNSGILFGHKREEYMYNIDLEIIMLSKKGQTARNWIWIFFSECFLPHCQRFQFK